MLVASAGVSVIAAIRGWMWFADRNSTTQRIAVTLIAIPQATGCFGRTQPAKNAVRFDANPLIELSHRAALAIDFFPHAVGFRHDQVDQLLEVRL